jgi:transcriptional regulator with GAF, ATPase, and Fis domain
MLAKLKRIAEERQRKENTYLKSREKTRRFEGMIGESAAIQRLTSQLRKVVDTRVTVLIEGETGTGKELVASAVHYWSNRKDRLFVAQNCAAMPENLLESELFGHKKGAFTGATEDKKGLFELADLGTLFLDEVGEMPLSLQAKLLRVLQEGEVRPVGSNTTRKVDVRIVAATNRTLENEVREGRFREDLYYRLQVFPLRAAAAARARRRRAAPRGALPRALRAGLRALRHVLSQRRWSCCRPTTGRATCASSRTKCSAWSSRWTTRSSCSPST